MRDHRVHHKFTDTDADPHNAQRGFFFSYMGWLLIRKHPDVINKGATIDMTDLEKDFVVIWQRRYKRDTSFKRAIILLKDQPLNTISYEYLCGSDAIETH